MFPEAFGVSTLASLAQLPLFNVISTVNEVIECWYPSKSLIVLLKEPKPSSFPAPASVKGPGVNAPKPESVRLFNATIDWIVTAVRVEAEGPAVSEQIHVRPDLIADDRDGGLSGADQVHRYGPIRPRGIAEATIIGGQGEDKGGLGCGCH